MIFSRNKKEEELISLVEKNGNNIRFIKAKWQTPKVCYAALKNNPYSIKYIKNQKEEYRLFAINLRSAVLRLLNNQTEKECIAAVEKYGGTLKYVKNQTEKICLAAVKEYPPIIDIVENKTEEMIMIYEIYEPL